MTNGDYFFLVFLGTIAITRFFIFALKKPGPTIRGFRIRHYMEGIVLVIIAFIFHDLTFFAMGFGWVIDELPVILAKGPGHKDEYWRGCEDYHTPWSVAGVLILIFITYIFRNTISGLI